jgi:1,4-dihydroxy-2-naphthoate octaprenyltransferase
MRTLIVVLLVAAVVLLAIAIYWFASIHPRRGALFVVLGALCLVGAWLSNRTARQRAVH